MFEVMVAVAGTLIAAAAIVVSVRNLRHQLWLQTFSEFTRRYNELAAALPPGARDPDGHLDLEAVIGAERERLINVARGYVNLCSEEFWLREYRRIDARTFAIWTVGMHDMMRLDWLRRAWAEIRDEYVHYREFTDFFDAIVKQEAAAEAASTVSR